VQHEPHEHIGLLADHRGDGSPFIEMVPAHALGGGDFEVLATPGIAIGCAAGDRITVADDGSTRMSSMDSSRKPPRQSRTQSSAPIRHHGGARG
jgi:hypothetical protein